MKSRNAVGGYSTANMDTEFTQSREVMDIANFALMEHYANNNAEAGEQQLAVLQEKVENGAVNAKVLEARRQVRL